MPFIVTSKCEILKINLTKDRLWKSQNIAEIKGDLINRIYHVDGSEDLILLRCQFSTNWSIDSIRFLKIPVGIFVEIDKPILKFRWIYIEPRMVSKITLKKKN